jgi:hypothetical protein
MLTPTIRRLIVCGARAEREKKARPAQAQSEARADACNEAHRRRAGEHGEHEQRKGLDRQIEEKPENRRKQRERNAGGDPMGEALHRSDKLERQRPGGQHIERAVLIVIVEDAVGGE